MLPKILLAFAALNWQPVNDHLIAELTPVQQNWILHSGSMTQKMETAFDGNVKIEVLKSEVSHPDPVSADILQIKTESDVLVREVMILCDDTPCLLAKTTVPVSALHGDFKNLETLGSVPLGKLLFSDPDIKRSEFELSKIEGNWARRSVFTLKTGRLLLHEVFLNEMWGRLAADAR